MAAHPLRPVVCKLFAMGPELGSARRAYSAFQAFTEVLPLPSKQLTKLVFPLQELHGHFVPGSRPDLHLNVFHPSLEDIARAESCFKASARNRIEYLTAAVRLDHAPDLRHPEVSVAAACGYWGPGLWFCCNLLATSDVSGNEPACRCRWT